MEAPTKGAPTKKKKAAPSAADLAVAAATGGARQADMAAVKGEQGGWRWVGGWVGGWRGGRVGGWGWCLHMRT